MNHTQEFNAFNNTEDINKRKREVAVDEIAKLVIQFIDREAKILNKSFPKKLDKTEVINSMNTVIDKLQNKLDTLENEEKETINTISPLGQRLRITPHIASERGEKQAQIKNFILLISALRDMQGYFSSIDKIDKQTVQEMRIAINNNINYWIIADKAKHPETENNFFNIQPNNKTISEQDKERIARSIMADQICGALLTLKEKPFGGIMVSPDNQ